MQPVLPSALPPPEPVAPRRPPTEGKAVVAMTLAILGLTGAACGFGLVFGAPAIVFAGAALRDIRRSRGQMGGRRVAAAAALLGVASSVLFFAWVAAVATLLNASRTLP